MKINDLLDLTLREVLEKYEAVYNLECCYYYGIASTDMLDDIYNEYNIEEYSEAFTVESLINEQLLLDCDEEVLSREKIERILDNLGISKKTVEE